MIRRTLLLAALAVSACAKPDTPASAANEKIEVGLPSPSYAATSMTGDTVSLAGLRGKVVLLNVWATWCGPCRKEIPELRAIHAAYKDRGFELIGVSVDAEGTDEPIRAFLKEFQMDYTIWRDPNEGVSATFRMAGVPATFLIDRKGILRWKATGAVEPGDTSLTNAIQKAISGD
jgi:cytochrome c biogenesis protein CcmG/thiol:disulfide interchange protein DsbE